MSCEKFDPSCPNCRPCLVDPKTGQRIPESDPAMRAVNAVWDASPLADHEAFFRVTVQNGRDPDDLRRMGDFWRRVQATSAN